jgi:L-methionine (R)-S-oxide reductase
MWQPDTNIRRSALALIEGEKNLIANLANLSALIYHTLPDLNWAGFYLWSEVDQELVLGPFQGKPACIRIKADRGVCGHAYTTQSVTVVDDVHKFPNHIACDSETRSELVIPLMKDGRCLGVLDLDSPKISRFTQNEADELNKIFIEIITHIFKEIK